MKPCSCEHATCRLCWLWANDQRYRTLWGGDTLKNKRRRSFGHVNKTLKIADCIHLGGILDRANAEGVSCACQWKWLRSCDEHGTCRVNEVWDGADCQSCGLYWSRSNPGEPPDVGSIRHLLYFICPLSGNGVWQRNVDQLLKRIDLFNGKRVIAIVTGNVQKRGMRPQRMDDPETVKSKFSGCEFVVIPNERDIGEVAAWQPLWSKVLPSGPGDVTFYGHAKGVTRPPHSPAHRWTEILYESSLDYWPLVQEQLRQFPVTGSFKKLGFCFPTVNSSFHYSGTFVWWRNADMVQRSWQAVPRQWAGTESMPGILYKPEEAGCLFHEAFGTVLNCYSVDYMTRVVEPEYIKWKEANGAYRVQDAGRVPDQAVQA